MTANVLLVFSRGFVSFKKVIIILLHILIGRLIGCLRYLRSKDIFNAYNFFGFKLFNYGMNSWITRTCDMMRNGNSIEFNIYGIRLRSF